MSREFISPTAELDLLGPQCQQLRLTRVAQTLPTLLEQGASAELSSSAFLHTVLATEVAADMKNSVENEWLCHRLLSQWGLPTARAELARFRDNVSEESVLVVERFDRRLQTDEHTSDSWLIRLPQEDLCQAFGQPRDKKYEAD